MAGNASPPNDGKFSTNAAANDAGGLGKGGAPVNPPNKMMVGMGDPHGKMASPVNPPNHRFAAGTSGTNYPPAPTQPARGGIPVQAGEAVEEVAELGKAR